MVNWSKKKAAFMNRKRKIVLAVMCALSMMMHTFTVSAAEGTAAQHSHVEGVIKIEYLEWYTHKDGSSHWRDCRITYGCQDEDCKAVTKVEMTKVTESHSWEWFDDLGCQGAHRYRLKCGKCGGTTEISIICDGNISGKHITPW